MSSLLGTAGYPIKSIRAISIAIGAAATSGTATLSPAVVAANCLLVSGGYESPNVNGAQYVHAYAVITNGTTVTATRGAQDATNGATWKGYVIEFQAGAVKSAGSALITVDTGGAQTSATAMIAAVVTANTLVVSTGMLFTSNGGTASAQVMTGDVVLTNTTTITATRAAGNANGYSQGYSYVEFNGVG